MKCTNRMRINKCLVMILAAALIVQAVSPGIPEVSAAAVLKTQDYMDTGACGKNLSYVLDGDGVLNITGEGGMTEFSNASAVPWFQYRSLIKTVVFSGNITSISAHAFEYCVNLSELAVPDSVTGIGASAFYGCTGLTSVRLGNRVEKIGASAFAGCTGLSGIAIPDSVTSIGEEAFDGTGVDTSQIVFQKGSCGENLTWVLMGNHKLYINGTGDMTDFSAGKAPWYSERENLSEVILAEGVSSIGAYAFEQCTALSSIDLGGITKISDHAFYGAGLTALAISGGEKVTISDYAFSGCKKLGEVQIPEGVTELGSYAFQNCSGIRNMVVPSSVMVLKDGVFDHCSGLENLSLPAGLQSVGSSVFAECSSLTELKLPQGITKIEKETFLGCSRIKKMELPKGITAIGENAFKGCAGITQITVPDGVTSIGSAAFSGCSSLQSMELPFAGSSADQTAASRTSLFGHIFGTTKYAGATPVRQKYSGSGAVDYYIPDSLHEVTVSGGTVLYGTFSGCTGLTRLTLPEKITELGAYACSGCTGLTDLSLPKKLTGIGDYAFSGCTGLTGVTLPGTLTKLGNYAYKDCTALGNIVIPHGVTTIGNYAFQNCSHMMKITVPDSVTAIGTAAFSGCSSLQSITLPFVGGSSAPASASSKTVFGYVFGTRSYTGGVAVKQFYSAGGSSTCYLPESLKHVVITGGNKLLYGAFHNCSGLASVLLPESLTMIGEKAFSGCTGIKEITVPKQVSNIANYAFDGCSGMQCITFTGNAPATIAARAFQDDTLTAYYPVSDSTWSDYVKNPGSHQYGGKLTWKSHTHSYQAGVKTAPTCTEQGYTTYQCTGCQSFYKSDFVNAAGHVPVTDQAVKETCTNVGLTEGSHCSVCQTVITAQVEIPKTGHKFADYVSNKDATYDADGTMTGTCSTCGEKETVTDPDSRLVDRRKPSLEILLGTNRWTGLLETVTFGLCFREAQTVEIQAADNESLLDGSTVSRLDGVYYYLSDQVLQADELDSVSWNRYTAKFQVNPGKKCIVYAKAEDRSGNTSYASSAGIIVDDAPPAMEGITEGAVYCEKAEFHVSDLSLKEVTDNGKSITPSDGGYVITGDDGRHTVTAVDDCGNKSAVTLTVKKNHIWGEPVFVWGDGYAECTAEYACGNDSSHINGVPCKVTVKAPAGCVAAWEAVYTAAAVLDGVEKTAVKKVSGAARGHDYAVGFAWSEDHSSCKATLTCQRAGCSADTAGHLLDGLECVVETKTTAATCVTPGTKSVTAAVTVEGVKYTEDGSTESLPVDPDHHTNLQVVGKKEATETEDGYTGDTWCADCETVIANGSVIPATGEKTETPGPGSTGKPGETPSGIPSAMPGPGSTGTPGGTPSGIPSATPVPGPGSTGKPGETPSGIPSAMPGPGSTGTPGGIPSATPVPGPGSTGKPEETPSATPVPGPGSTGTPGGIPSAMPEPGSTGMPGAAPSGMGTPAPGSAGKLPSEGLPAAGTVVVSGKLKYELTASASGGLTAGVKAPVSKKAGNLTIPAEIKVNGKTCKVASIAPGAFKNCTKLKKITIGKNVAAIGKNAFYKAKKLKTIVVRSSVLKSVGKNAWKGIHKKAVIRVPRKKMATYKKIFGKKGRKLLRG